MKRWKLKKKKVVKKTMSLIKLTLRRQAFTLYQAPRDPLQKKLRSTMPRICPTGVGAQYA